MQADETYFATETHGIKELPLEFRSCFHFFPVDRLEEFRF
jgi:hypothetical protein